MFVQSTDLESRSTNFGLGVVNNVDLKQRPQDKDKNGYQGQEALIVVVKWVTCWRLPTSQEGSPT